MRNLAFCTLLALAYSVQTQLSWEIADGSVSSIGLKLQNGFERIYIQVYLYYAL
jgi:hypothetical protein